MAADFALEGEFVVQDVPVRRYRSVESGLTVIVAGVPGPLVYANVVVATEPRGDDGCPHTLEHLVFLGSQQYPWKGVLDKLANRCLAQGTNAWTDTDHTNYTLETAGAAGCLQLLPVYMDHLLFPTLTDAGFTTEVHHIDGQGEDSGVVYCEIQASENTDAELVHYHVRRLLYPESSYRFDAGGRMAELRTLDADTVRAYHQQFYRSSNMCVIITGQVEPADVFDALRPCVRQCAARGDGQVARMAWVADVPPLQESERLEVPFPADEEDDGLVALAWRGPPVNDARRLVALGVLWEYLCGIPEVSPLRRELVDVDSPLASDITTGTMTFRTSSQYVLFENVPVESLDDVEEDVLDVLQGVLEDGVDLDLIHTILHREKMKYYDEMECDAHDAVRLAVIDHFVYAADPATLEPHMRVDRHLDALRQEDAAFWATLLQDSIVDAPLVCIRGRPSEEEGQRIAAADAARLAAQAESLGPARLAELGAALTAAAAANDAPIPPDALTVVDAPDPRAVPRFDVPSWRFDGDAVSRSSSDETLAVLNGHTPPPLPVQFNQTASRFVRLSALIDSSGLDAAHRVLLEVFLEALFQAPVRRGGGAELTPKDEVVTHLTEDTVSYSNDIGFGGGNFVCGDFAQLVRVSLKVEAAKYATGVAWLRDILYHVAFDGPCIAVAVAKLTQDLSEKRRDVDAVCRALHTCLYLDEDRSNHGATSPLRQAAVLKTLAHRLESEPAAVVADFVACYQQLVRRPGALAVHVVGDAAALGADPLAPVRACFGPLGCDDGARVPAWRAAPLTRALRAPGVGGGGLGRGYVVGLSSAESATVVHSVDAPAAFDDPALAALETLDEMLSACEGAMWRRIRGQGLAYGFYASVSVERGTHSFVLTQCGHATAAYAEAAALVRGLASGDVPLDSVELEEAKSALSFAVIAKEETVAMAARQSLLLTLKGLPQDHVAALLERILAVTADDVRGAIERYLVPVFDPARSRMAVCGPKAKREEMAGVFAAMGRDVLPMQDVESILPQSDD